MRLPYAAAVALLAGLTGCSSTDMDQGQSARSSDTTGSAAATMPSTGGSGSSMTSEAQVRQNLRDHGYSNLSNLQRSGDDWIGTATDSSGNPVNFDVNPSGVIVIMP